MCAFFRHSLEPHPSHLPPQPAFLLNTTARAWPVAPETVPPPSEHRLPPSALQLLHSGMHRRQAHECGWLSGAPKSASPGYRSMPQLVHSWCLPCRLERWAEVERAGCASSCPEMQVPLKTPSPGARHVPSPMCSMLSSSFEATGAHPGCALRSPGCSQNITTLKLGSSCRQYF